MMHDLARIIEEMERDLKRIDWQDVVIFCTAAALIVGWIAGVVLEWW